MARIITKQLALQIAQKLGAVLKHSKKNRPHDLYAVYEDGALITHFGIRRGSSKEAGHDHIPKQILVSPNDARNLGLCPMSRTQYIAKLKSKGKI